MHLQQSESQFLHVVAVESARKALYLAWYVCGNLVLG